MSTNYFIKTKDPEMAFDLMPRVEISKQDRCFMIHICQTQCSAWNLKPLLESHSYHSFKELKDILCNKKYTFDIVDEYGSKWEVEEFISFLEKENKGKTRKTAGLNIQTDEDGYEFLDSDFA